MSIANEKHSPEITLTGWMSIIGSQYGPYAFGIVSLMTIWFFIVGPELTARRIDYDMNLKVIEQLQNLQLSMQQTQIVMQQTQGQQLEIVQSLKNAIDKMPQNGTRQN